MPPRPRRKLALILLLALPLLIATPAVAQSNPPLDACGLPKGGAITTAVTYTLSSNCTQTGELRGDATLPANAKIVIDGKGYTVDATALNNSKPFFYCVGGNANVQLEIKDLTIKGGGASSSGALYFWRCNVKLTRVTLTDSFRQAIWAYADNPDYSYTYELTNMLVEMPNGAYRYNYLHSPGALAFSGNTTIKIRDIVLRDMVGVAAAVVNSHYYSGNTSITFSGCLSVERVYAQFRHGAITNNSSGKCTGAIGNGGNADLPNPPPPVSDCGLPLQGHLQSSAAYSLTADCQLTGPLFIRKGLTVNIQGNGYTIKCASGKRGIHSAGATTISAVVFDGCDSFSIVAHLRSKLVVRRCTFKNQKRPLRIIDAAVTFDQALFEDNDVGAYGGSSALLVLRSAKITIRNSTFNNNSGGQGAILLASPHNHSGVITKPAVTLTGSTNFTSNSPTDIVISNGDQGTLIDNRDGKACDCEIGAPPPGTFPPAPPPPARSAGRAAAAPPAASAAACQQQFMLGAYAMVCRENQAGQPVLSIWGIDRQTSQGSHLLTVGQAQVDGTSGAGVIASSSDCRAQILLDGEGDVIVKVGPNYEGKMLHAALDSSLMGAVISQYTSFDDPICAPAPQAAPETVSSCMAQLNHILNFRETPGGAVMRILPYGVTLTVLQRSGDWVEVDYHGQRGWVSASHVTFVGGC